MSQSQPTRHSLLARLGDFKDADAWVEFVELYTPLIFGWTRQRGLQDADAADLAQEVMRAVAKALPAGRYDRAHGRFSAWLYTITSRKILDFRRKQAGHLNAGQDLLGAVQSLDDSEAHWQREYEARVFAWAGERVRGEVSEQAWQAFWLTAVEGRSGTEACSTLGITVGAVYAARCRIKARLREVVRDAEGNGDNHKR